MNQIIGGISLLAVMLSSAAILSIGWNSDVAPIPQDELESSIQEKVNPVVVELFTSQGCNSCPPADDVLSEFASRKSILGARIIPISFHVDYWDRLGWTDPFGDRRHSERQRAYNERFEINSFTPQMVVDGNVSLIGSQRQRLMAAIDRERRRPKLTVELNATGKPNGDLFVELNTPQPPESRKHLEWVVVITQDGLVQEITSGENAGKTLHHDSVVRFYERVPAFTDENNSRQTIEFSASALPQTGTDYNLVVMLQNTKEGNILGANSVPVKLNVP